MSGREVGEPDEKLDHLGLQDRREVKMFLASVDETSQTVVYSDAISVLDLKPKKCDCSVLNTPHQHFEHSLLVTPFGLYLFPPMIEVGPNERFLITTESKQYHIKDIALVSLPYRNEKEGAGGESDVAWRANDVVIHFLDSSCLWIQTRVGQRSLVTEVLSDTYEALMGVALEMHQPDCDELSLLVVGLGTSADRTLDDMIASFRAEAQLRMKTVSMQGWLYYATCVMPDNENGILNGSKAAPIFQLRYVVLSSSDRLYIFKSPSELEATRCVSPNFNSRKATYNLPAQLTRRVSYNLPAPIPGPTLNTKKKMNKEYSTLKLSEKDMKLAAESMQEAEAAGPPNAVLDLVGTACHWSRNGFDIVETRQSAASTSRWGYRTKKESVERIAHLFLSVPSDKIPEGNSRVGVNGLTPTPSSINFNLAPTDEKAEVVLWVSRIERAIYNKTGKIEPQEQDLRMLKSLRELANQALAKTDLPRDVSTMSLSSKQQDTRENKDTLKSDQKQKEKIKEDQERDLALYGIKTLTELTSDPFGKELLWKFCKAQFNEENMKYLEAIEEYEAAYKDPYQTNKSVFLHGKRICDQFFVPNAPSLLNISSEYSKQVLNAFKEQPTNTMVTERPPANIFYNTTQEIYKLLNTNSFKLFTRSEYHQQWIDYKKDAAAQEESKKDVSKTLSRLKLAATAMKGTKQSSKKPSTKENGHSDSTSTTSTDQTTAIIRIPGRFFEHSQLQSLEIAFNNDDTTEQITKLAVKLFRSIPGVQPKHMLPDSFSLFRLDGRGMFVENQTLVSQVAQGVPIEILLKESSSSFSTSVSSSPELIKRPASPTPSVASMTQSDRDSYNDLWDDLDGAIQTRRRAVLDDGRPPASNLIASSSSQTSESEQEHPTFASLLQQLQGVLAKGKPIEPASPDKTSAILAVSPGEDYSKLLHDHLQLLIRTATRVKSQQAPNLVSPTASYSSSGCNSSAPSSTYLPSNSTSSRRYSATSTSSAERRLSGINDYNGAWKARSLSTHANERTHSLSGGTKDRVSSFSGLKDRERSSLVLDPRMPSFSGMVEREHSLSAANQSELSGNDRERLTSVPDRRRSLSGTCEPRLPESYANPRLSTSSAVGQLLQDAEIEKLSTRSRPNTFYGTESSVAGSNLATYHAQRD